VSDVGRLKTSGLEITNKIWFKWVPKLGVGRQEKYIKAEFFRKASNMNQSK
jgi:hypothetical protein